MTERWDDVMRRAIEKTRRAELHQKLDEVLTTTPLGKDLDSDHFRVIRYVINSAYDATASERQEGAPTKAHKAIGPIYAIQRRLRAKERIPSWEIGRAKWEQIRFDDRARRAALHRKLDEILATTPGRDRQSAHVQAVKYVIDSAHNATASKRQSAWYIEKTKSG